MPKYAKIREKHKKSLSSHHYERVPLYCVNMLRLLLFLPDCGDPPAAAHHVREGDNGGIRLPLHRQTLQDFQGQEIPLHAHGVMSRRGAMDYPQVRQRSCMREPSSEVQYLSIQ